MVRIQHLILGLVIAICCSTAHAYHFANPYDQQQALEANSQRSTLESLTLAQLYASDGRQSDARMIIDLFDYETLQPHEQSAYGLVELLMGSDVFTHEELIEIAERTIQLARQTGDHQTRINALTLRAQFHSLMRNFPAAFNDLQAAIAVAQDHQTDSLAIIEYTRHIYHLDANRREAARESAERAFNEATQEGLDLLAIRLLFNQAITQYFQGEAIGPVEDLVTQLRPYTERYESARYGIAILDFAIADGDGTVTEAQLIEFLAYIDVVQSPSLQLSMLELAAFAQARMSGELPVATLDKMAIALDSMPDSSLSQILLEQQLYANYAIRRELNVDLEGALTALEEYMAVANESWQQTDIAVEQNLELDIRTQVLNYENEVLQLRNETQQQALENSQQARTILLLLVISALSLLAVLGVAIWLGIKRLRTISLHAATDGLTGVANRREFDRVLNLWRSSKMNFAVLMIDADYFKRINDQYGHDTGDQVLKHLVDVIKACCRSSDVICRYGGEEFAVLLPDVSSEQLTRCAERIRRSVEAQPYGREHLELPITVSIGGANSSEMDDLDHIVEIADQRLYRAKNLGRNLSVLVDD